MRAATAAAWLALLALGRVSDSPAAQYGDGAALFSANCQVCHGATAAGTPGLAPPLTGNPARYASMAQGRRQLALTVLYGMFGDVTVGQQHFNFKMPAFAQLEDTQLAAILNFLVFDVDHAGSNISALQPADIAAERNKGLDGAAVRAHREQVLKALGME